MVVGKMKRFCSVELAYTILGKSVGPSRSFERYLDQGVRVVDNHVRVCDHTGISHIFVHIFFPSLIVGTLMDLNCLPYSMTAANPKHEIRNSKQSLMTKIQMI
jgi:hypothetical protein